MSGFLKRFGDSPLFKSVSPALKNFTNRGMKLDDLMVKQSLSIGLVEGEMGHGYMPNDILHAMRLADVGPNKYIAFFDKDYKSRRNENRKFAMHSEIEFILDTIADEAIVYDDDNYFAYPEVGQLQVMLQLEKEKKDKIIEDVYTEFRYIYGAFGFNDHGKAWNLFRKFLVDGFLAFEIVYDTNGKGILGFKEIDVTTIQPDIQGDTAGGQARKIWVQFPEDPSRRRIIPDTSIIYISYAAGGVAFGRTSYVERLVRSFALLRHMEDSRVIWTIMNSFFRVKMVVPVGSKSEAKAQQSLGEMLSKHKEEVSIDSNSGELTYNGRAQIPYFKNYMVQANSKGEQTEISVMGGDGFDLSDPAPLGYFQDKLKTDSKIPFGRFDHSQGGGQYVIGPESIDREEIRFNRFITRLRSTFQEILYKPLLVQMSLKHPELQDDDMFKTALGIKFTMDNLFEELKTQEVLKRNADAVTTLMQLAPSENSYFDLDYLVEKYLGLTIEDIKENKRRKKEASKKDDSSDDSDEASGGVGL